MSSSNEVQLSYIKETVFGETPLAGNFSQARFTSESLSATPDTVESAQIRTDRLSSGQVLTGLSLSGDISVEFAKAGDVDDFFEGAMMSTWSTGAATVSVDLDIDTTAKTITRASGDWNTNESVGDVINLTNFASSSNNTAVMISEIQSATVIKYIGPNDMVDEVGIGTDYTPADKISIGTTRNSYSIEKKFNDLTTKGLIYTGSYIDGFTMTATYGEIVNGSFSFAMANYSAADQAAELITDGRTVDPAATSTSLNGSVDLAFLGSQDSGTFQDVDFCVQSVEISLANNLTPQNCVGKIGPDNYSLGTASVSVSISAYLSDDSWSLLEKKLTQDAFSIGFLLKNSGGYYGFYMPQVQITFDDPASAGQNTDIIITATGVAKVGANNESSLTLFKSA